MKAYLLPSVTYPDIVNYLVFSPSPYSSEDLKSYKGLDAYNQFVYLHIEQITFDSEMWNEMCAKTKHIFVTAILPELIGKFYSRLPNTNILSASACNSSRSGESETSSCITNEELWCFCNQVESGRMMCCDNDKCKLKWFHYLCLGISCAPRGKWYCPDCRKLSQFQSKRGKKPAK
ncbi:hypothetical protein ACJMK2_025263 [Sinanodonta woodiana]|uniref:PHD-type domain-containing protein n=1 Tax=Sinanodonta woodiana TaxID=1069815 RepID=A0ABD3XIC3_SINWO